MTKAYIILAEGFEEIELITPVDILRRAEIDTRIVTLNSNNNPVRGAHDIFITPDISISDISEQDVDILILPGGMGGTERMARDQRVLQLTKSCFEQNKIIAAICAAPLVLAQAGIIKGKSVTSHPSTKDTVKEASYKEERVVVDLPLITSRGPGTAIEFAFAIIEQIYGKTKVDAMNTGIQAKLK